MSEAPRAFVSHATEDKERFVVEFATRLRALGIDAWVDQWEIRAGDSLVDKVFAHGIEKASVFIVVLSRVSVIKNWVREELDAGVVRRIDQGTKLIPILLDEVEVPSALKHLFYVSVPKLGLNGVVGAVRDAIFGGSSAPPLGRPPAFTRTLPRLMSDPIDDLVFLAIVDHQLDNAAQMIRGESLLPALREHDINVEQIQESLESLRDLGVIETLDTLGGTSFVQKVKGRHWLRAMAARGVDVETTRMDLLVHLANHQQTAGFSQTDPTTLEALVDDLRYSGHIEIPLWTMGGTAHVDVTVAGRRLARSR
jgi:hypothetical protein